MLLRLSGTMLHGAVLLAAAGLVAFPAVAQERIIDRADLPQVMTAYVETVVDLRNILAACAPAQPGKWDEGAAILIESLRAASMPAPGLALLQARLASPLATESIDCSGDEMMLRSGLPSGSDWEGFHRDILARAGVPVAEPVGGDERLAAAQAAIEAALEPQARMLACLSLFDPLGFVVSFGDWDALIVRLDGVFAKAGYAPHTYRPILEQAAAATLFVQPTDRAGAIASCVAEQAWSNRFAGFEWFTLLDEVARPLGVANP